MSIQSSFAGEIPIVSREQFKVGNYWVWTYYTDGDFSKPYSSEKYEVVSVEGTRVTIELQSRPQDRGEFTSKVRFRADFTQCENAFQRRDVKVNFMVALFPLENGNWAKTPIPSPATIFEEKFNCNPILHSKKNSMYETRFETMKMQSEAFELFQQWPKYSKSQILAFYFLDHPQLKGVAYKKDFNPNTSGHYEMRLTDWGSLP
ncbi:MAG: hypothetical protein ABIQ95_09500 [Bdellovibrionia bacterium]